MTSTIKADSVETIELTTNTLTHLASATATLYRRGNKGIIKIYMKNTASDVAVGDDVSFKVSGLPRPLLCESRGIGFSGATAMVCLVGMDGGVLARAIGSAWVRNYDVVCEVTVVFA